jgi:hypothetical protein
MAAPGFDPLFEKVKDTREAAYRSKQKLQSVSEEFNAALVQSIEKLVLLDGGALAASTTYLGYSGQSIGSLQL